MPKSGLVIEKPQKKNAQILWVDDHPDNNSSIMNLYQRRGVKFYLAEDTEKAMEYLNRINYDLIISKIEYNSKENMGILMLHNMRKYSGLPSQIFIYDNNLEYIKKYGDIAKEEGASFVTPSG